MADVFKEQLIKRKTTTTDRLIKFAAVFGVVLIFLFSMLLVPMLAPVITIAAAFGVYVLTGKLNKEYEYTFTNGELDIDVIYNKSSRKRVFTGEVKDFEIMAHVDDQNNKNSLTAASERLDYSSGVPSDRSYAFLTNYNSKRVAIVIEPNDDMLDTIARVLTRRKFYPKK